MKYVVLYSGGIDSTAVVLILEKLGVEYEIAHFIVSPTATKGALLTLYHIGIRDKPLHLWDHREFLRTVSKINPPLTCLACKRAMVEVASKIGRPVTGDSLGQVASQTLYNLRVIGSAARPLLGADKEDVDLFLIRTLKELRKVELVRKGSVHSCPFKPAAPVVRATKRHAEEVARLVKEYAYTIKYLGMKRSADVTLLG